MCTSLLKNLCLSAVAAMLVTSCGTTPDSAATSGITKVAGDAAVDAVTKETNPIAGAAIRQTTGYGTDPVEKAKTDVLNKVGL